MREAGLADVATRDTEIGLVRVSGGYPGEAGQGDGQDN
jgi:hypothetical protein